MDGLPRDGRRSRRRAPRAHHRRRGRRLGLAAWALKEAGLPRSPGWPPARPCTPCSWWRWARSGQASCARWRAGRDAAAYVAVDANVLLAAWGRDPQASAPRGHRAGRERRPRRPAGEPAQLGARRSRAPTRYRCGCAAAASGATWRCRSGPRATAPTCSGPPRRCCPAGSGCRRCRPSTISRRCSFRAASRSKSSVPSAGRSRGRCGARPRDRRVACDRARGRRSLGRAKRVTWWATGWTTASARATRPSSGDGRRPQFGLGARLCSHVGSLEPRKGLDVLISAAALKPGWQLVLVGQPAHEAERILGRRTPGWSGLAGGRGRRRAGAPLPRRRGRGAAVALQGFGIVPWRRWPRPPRWWWQPTRRADRGSRRRRDPGGGAHRRGVGGGDRAGSARAWVGSSSWDSGRQRATAGRAWRADVRAVLADAAGR